ncbi:unnamed protein product [Phytophthora fragariaefolia]|uniref:Unnamed protein product n=1 Tax=Phytophthora fragariaefolia TaxID=1490495 RepID=A0A9W6X9U0_9STRA|nr:unnamed protein product [Phytophthora fragariaefolia]
MFRSVSKLWESTQVELRGKYSAERVLDLTKYVDETSWLRVISAMLATPVLCLLVTVAVDIIPLAKPSEGIEANNSYFVRTYYTFLVITFLAIQQFRMNVSILPYSIGQALGYTLAISAISTGILYELTLVIGFPLPFSLLTTTPRWVALISITMIFEWGRKIRQTPGAATMLINTTKLWMCEVLLVFVYPPYFYIFTTLSEKAQMVFALLLPVIKMCMRNLFSRTILHITDELPEVVIFNCDVFNALFVAYCMQNSPSMWTTLEIMTVDIIMMVISLRDAEITKKTLKDLEARIEREFAWDSYRSICSKSRNPTTLDKASKLLRLRRDAKLQTRISSFLELKRVASVVNSIVPGPPNVHTLAVKRKMSSVWPANNSIRKLSSRGAAQVSPVTRVAKHDMPKLPVTIRYTRLVQRLLYLSEFILLLNYVEVVIPLVFCKYNCSSGFHSITNSFLHEHSAMYLYGMYHLPNREYYAQLHGMTESELVLTLKNVLFYCSLQLVSLLLLFFALKRQLGFSPIHQLAFVLDKQFVGIQVKLVFWVYYNAQASLEHSGESTRTIYVIMLC